MFIINEKKQILITRGDIGNIVVSARLQDQSAYMFQSGDVVRLTVVTKGNYEDIQLEKDVTVEAESETVTISLTKEDTKLGGYINKPVDYWYEIVVNPDTQPQTIIGHDTEGAKIFRIYPEGGKR